jgi:hypothetical protein
VHVVPPQPASDDSQSAHTSAVVMAIVAILFCFPSQIWAHSCSTMSSLSALPTICDIRETTSAASRAAITTASLATRAPGAVLVYDDAGHGSPNEGVIFIPKNGVATVTFLSGSRQNLSVPRDLAILGTFAVKHSPLMVSVALTDGQFLDTKICRDVADRGCRDATDLTQLPVSKSMIPEPETFLLVGSGVLGAGTSSWLRSQIRPSPRIVSVAALCTTADAAPTRSGVPARICS